MAHEMNWKCHQCNMVFQNPALLQKHRDRFCVGIGDPDEMFFRRSQEPRPASPELVTDILESKREELLALKERKAKEREVRDLEERLLLDDLQDMEPRPRQQGAGKVHLSKDKDVRQMQIEYERNRERRRLQADPGPVRRGRHTRRNAQTRHSDSSLSMHLPSENDPPRYNPNADPKLKQLAESHGRNMEYLGNRNRDLERQRDEIRRRLEELGRRPIKGDDSTAALLQELREQEARNQRLLEELRRQLLQARGPINIIQQSEERRQGKSFTYPIYYGNSLVAEISAIRQAYLQNGGADPDILAQMSQMQAEAQAIEDAMRSAQLKSKTKDKREPGMHSLTTLELENERLQRELLLLQEQNVISKNRRKDDREDDLERELRRLQKEHLRKMYELQRSIEQLRHEYMIERIHYRDEKPSLIIQQPALQAQPPPAQVIQLDAMAPYDQYAGFIIFYDFVLHLDPSISAVRLIVGLHNSTAKLGEPSILPTVYTEPSTRQNYLHNVSNAVIGARQPVPKCPPQQDLGIVAELQVTGGPGSEHDTHHLITRAWTKIPLFDNQGRLLAGRYKIPLRSVPIKPFLPPQELISIEQYGDTELYYRIFNMRDAGAQSLATIAATNQDMYQIAPAGAGVLLQKPITPPYVPPPPSTPPLDSPIDYLSPRRSSRLEKHFPPIGISNQLQSDPNIGFQVDKVKHAEAGEGKIRITAYYATTGKVVQSSTSPVTCSTTAVRSNFRYGYHIFGQQEATFHNVNLQGDMMLIVRFYLRRRLQGTGEEQYQDAAQEASLYSEETLAAWGALPLVITPRHNMSARARRDFDTSHMRINAGTHKLRLYMPPVPEPGRIPFDEIGHNRDWKRYGKSTVRIHIFYGQPRPGSLTPSEASDDNEDTLPEFAWLPLDRRHPPTEPFLTGDGFDVYIDACRFLPDSVTFSRVTGRILDRRYEMYGQDIVTSIKLDSDISNPVYEHKEEFRDPKIPPSATLLLKIYTIDAFYKQLTVVGYCTLNLFVETGTEKQPSIDKQGLQISLNEGAHQVRLYNQGPNGVDPFTESCLRDANVRVIPAATMLIRVTKVPKGPNGKPLVSSKVPQTEWLRLGLWHPRPKYTDRVYYSTKCVPTKGECRIFHAYQRRTPIPVREAVSKFAQAKDSFLKSDKNLEQFIKNQLTKSMDVKPLDQDLNFICQYAPKVGLKFAIDSAVNLPWNNFTHAHYCLNPPGAFYLGPPHATYDPLSFTETLDLRSTNTSPAWRDGFKHFPRRSYHRFMTIVIHLQEIFVTISKDNYKYGLLEQAWTAVQVFKDRYTYTAIFQLPLFQGAPSPQMLKQLAREPCKEWMERNIRNKTIHLLEGSSLFVRLCDGRREEELQSEIPVNRNVEVNTDFIPRGLEEQYARERPGRPLDTLIPQGKNPEQFIENLSLKFKSLVYKLYEEGNIAK